MVVRSQTYTRPRTCPLSTNQTLRRFFVLELPNRPSTKYTGAQLVELHFQLGAMLCSGTVIEQQRPFGSHAKETVPFS
jgi:hypothetical protein